MLPASFSSAPASAALQQQPAKPLAITPGGASEPTAPQPTTEGPKEPEVAAANDVAKDAASMPLPSSSSDGDADDADHDHTEDGEGSASGTDGAQQGEAAQSSAPSMPPPAFAGVCTLVL